MNSQHRLRMLRAIALAIPVLLLVALLRLTGLLEGPSLALYDQFNRLFAKPSRSERVVVVGFAESDFQFAGTYPVSDAMLADVIERVQVGKPAAIFLNLLRDVPVEPGNERLLAAYRAAPTLYAFDTAGPGQAAEVPAPPVLREAGRFGFLKSVADQDGVTRTLLLGFFENGQLYEAGLLKAMRAYLASQPGAQDITIDPSGTLHVGRRSLPALTSSRLDSADEVVEGLANYRLPFRHQEGVATVSFRDVVTGKVGAEFFRGKLVLIGTNALTLQRAQHTPLVGIASRGLAAVDVNAQGTANLLSFALDDWIGMRFLPKAIEWLLLSAIAWFACWRVLGFTSLWGGLMRGCIVILATLGISLFAYRLGWWLPILPALVALLGAIVVVVQNLVVAEASQRRFVGFMSEVFDRLPDPIYVIDDDGRFKLVNQAFCRLAVAEPARLMQQPAAQLFEQRDRSTGRDVQRVLISHSGERYRLRVNESVLVDERGRPMVLGMVQSLTPIDPLTDVPEADRFAQKFSAATYWAQHGEGALVLLLLELCDSDSIEQAYGHERLGQVLEAMIERLRNAFPDADAIIENAPRQVSILLSRSENSVEFTSLRALVAQAFSWPLQTDGDPVEIDLQLGIAIYGTDGNDMATLLASARSRLTELPLEAHSGELRP